MAFSHHQLSVFGKIHSKAYLLSVNMQSPTEASLMNEFLINQNKALQERNDALIIEVQTLTTMIKDLSEKLNDLTRLPHEPTTDMESDSSDVTIRSHASSISGVKRSQSTLKTSPKKKGKFKGDRNENLNGRRITQSSNDHPIPEDFPPP